ncbi:PorP/SprF family type IX secretion system membrane protein [Abyssalbus ytuae]|uniref:Type IX secretion system membrane protein PorP/SprF n=1 Tax=Abyssalbus ytuae TaxID=2926907 RepID=A0A9E7D2H3_9FLAO|nr:type IX secretion system membrane protein PorP/SprF [Abyssalbus ytuae]UOB16689.1 type IX secretion system membrane protein PorP/SprF [Abyssalbus ytuae]
MIKKTDILLFLFLAMAGSLCMAQQFSQFTQYMYNTVSVNPAYAGSREALSVIALHRTQWVGIEGAPQTSTFSFNSPVGRMNRVGIGFSAIHDIIGPLSQTYFDVDFSYNIRVSDKGKLFFGLKAGGQLLQVDFGKLSLFNIDDPVFQNNIDHRFSPNIGTGIYYHTDKFYGGISIPNLLKTEHFSSGNSSASIVNENRTHLHLISGYVFTLNENVKFKPAFISKLVYGAPLQLDLSANFLIYDKLILGAAFRWGASVSAMAGFQISNSFMIALAYDRETTELGNTAFNDGSFEAIIRFELPKMNVRRWTPRFF